MNRRLIDAAVCGVYVTSLWTAALAYDGHPAVSMLIATLGVAYFVGNLK
ncbi:MAG TPA: hypothetical protein PLN56_09865 [Methanoregulaceae archaeon]|nr:hypothetical protein [Methanothrix sp.]HOK07919.1 hypothetical protein [Syntrophales bacterium]HOL44432.1 hypothetical protein [Methanothrix sp.]HPD11282.1 hypothetical protein [Methanoregulaceae archaeon]